MIKIKKNQMEKKQEYLDQALLGSTSKDMAESDYLNQYSRCKKATIENVRFYQEFHPSEQINTKYVNIEGPETNIDFSFFAVNMLP